METTPIRNNALVAASESQPPVEQTPKSLLLSWHQALIDEANLKAKSYKERPALETIPKQAMQVNNQTSAKKVIESGGTNASAAAARQHKVSEAKVSMKPKEINVVKPPCEVPDCLCFAAEGATLCMLHICQEGNCTERVVSPSQLCVTHGGIQWCIRNSANILNNAKRASSQDTPIPAKKVKCTTDNNHANAATVSSNQGSSQPSTSVPSIQGISQPSKSMSTAATKQGNTQPSKSMSTAATKQGNTQPLKSMTTVATKQGNTQPSKAMTSSATSTGKSTQSMQTTAVNTANSTSKAKKKSSKPLSKPATKNSESQSASTAQQPKKSIASQEVFGQRPLPVTQLYSAARHSRKNFCTWPGCLKLSAGLNPKAENPKHLCKRHGGGVRCGFEGCTKSANGSKKLARCIRHGGGRRCGMPDCPKVAQGATPYCAAHGGGRRCDVLGCRKWPKGHGRCGEHLREMMADGFAIVKRGDILARESMR